MSELEHFLTSAVRSELPYASAGEIAAGRLARAIVENVGALDKSAIVGLLCYADLAYESPGEGAQLVRKIAKEQRP